jgi:hypothetical protein
MLHRAIPHVLLQRLRMAIEMASNGSNAAIQVI